MQWKLQVLVIKGKLFKDMTGYIAGICVCQSTIE